MLARARRAAVGIAALTCALTAPLAASAAPRAVALVGDPAPGTGGGTYSFFPETPVSINSAGEVAFAASIASGTTTSGLFVASSATSAAVAVAGQVAPGTGGGTYAILEHADINDAGQVAFTSTISGGTTTAGVFLDDGGLHTAVAVAGDTAPGAGGGTFVAFTGPVVNESGEVAFFATVTGGTKSSGIFLATTGGLVPIVFVGDTAPVVGGTVSLLGRPAVNDGGSVAYQAVLFDGMANSTAMFVGSGGTPSLVAAPGDVPSGAGGLAYFAFASTRPSIDASGDVAFMATLGATGSIDAIVVDAAGATGTAIALEGDPHPSPGGGTFFSLNSKPVLAASGDVAFGATSTSGNPFSGLFLADGTGVAAVALRGDPAPDTGGGTFGSFDNSPALSDAGDVAFASSIASGTASFGVFALPEPGAAGAGAALATLAALARGRRARAARRSARNGRTS